MASRSGLEDCVLILLYYLGYIEYLNLILIYMYKIIELLYCLVVIPIMTWGFHEKFAIMKIDVLLSYRSLVFLFVFP